MTGAIGDAIVIFLLFAVVIAIVLLVLFKG